MKIVIIGASGFLGTKLFTFLSKNHRVIGTYSKNKRENLLYLDATNKGEIENFLFQHKPDVVIDTVALTSSVACEKDPKLCKKLNYETARDLAEACQKLSSKMIFISSSYVFDGEKASYSELDAPNSNLQYSKWKIEAEKEVLKLKNSLVLRVDLFYGVEKGKIRFATSGFDREFIDIGYPNQLRSPLFIDDLSRVIGSLLEKDQSGIFNVAGPTNIKMIDFLMKLASLIHQENKIRIVDSSGWLVNSPKNSFLSIKKIENLGIKTTSLSDALRKIKEEINL